MRILGLDLGTTSLGVAISDKTNTLATPLETIDFKHEDYEKAIAKLQEIIDKYEITDIVLGLPKNMDNSLGFAAERSLNFKKRLEELNIKVHLMDERLSTVEATNILKNNGMKNINKKHIVDTVAACIILENYLRGIKNEE